jgi:pimeloyl-ACP methyl ester carboxylesterase
MRKFVGWLLLLSALGVTANRVDAGRRKIHELPLKGGPIGEIRLSSQAYVKPQRLIAVDGHRRLNLYCLGKGTPAVLLDAGTGGGTTDWRDVQGATARQTTVCSYDRAGYGFSDGPTRASDATNAVDDLYRLVLHAGLKKPLVMVVTRTAGSTQCYTRSPTRQRWAAWCWWIRASPGNRISNAMALGGTKCRS